MRKIIKNTKSTLSICKDCERYEDKKNGNICINCNKIYGSNKLKKNSVDLTKQSRKHNFLTKEYKENHSDQGDFYSEVTELGK